MLVDVNDPIQTHLLVETALSDSQEFEILSPDEVDNLKKQRRTLTTRIEQTRHNLAIQSKYRDAAISMSRLYSMSDKTRSPDGTEKKHRRSLLGSRGSHPDHVRGADLERLTSERKCEQLANELWILEKGLTDLQKRLLEHTAGILQITHKGPMRVPKTNVGVFQQGIPGSPESMYTYTAGRRSIEQASEEDIFDERSFYRMFDSMDNKSENYDLGGESISREMVAEHKETITKTEQKLEDLNNRLRAIIVKSNPQRESSLNNQLQLSLVEDSAPDMLISSHLHCLEQSISIINEDQRRLMDSKQDSDVQIEEAINDVNCKAQALLTSYSHDIPPPPEVTGENIKDQLQYFESTIGYISSEFQHAASAKDNIAEQQANIEKLEAVLRSIWDTIEAGDLKYRGLFKDAMGDDDNDVSDDEPPRPSPEIYSVQALSMKVQRLYTEASNLNDQKNVLQRQIKQQRELHSKQESTNDGRILQLEDELGRAQKDLQGAEKEADDLQAQLIVITTHLEEAQRGNTQYNLEKSRKVEAESVALKEMDAELQERNARITRLKEELQDLKDDDALRNAEILSQKVEAESVALKEMNAQLQEKNSRITRLEEELQDLKDDHALRNAEIQFQKVEAESVALNEMNAQLQERNVRIARLEEELQDLKDDHALRNAEIQSQKVEADSVALNEMNAQLQERNSRITRLEEELQDLKDDHALSNAEIQSQFATSALKIENLSFALAKAEEEVSKLRMHIDEKEAEMEGANMEIARLQTEVTIARAELDGAYGTRAQRAAEVASNPVIQKEIDNLNKLNMALHTEIDGLKATEGKVTKLEHELREMIEEYEEMTKASIEWEKEREALEREVDKLRDEIESLEGKLSDEQVRWMGVKGPGSESSPLGPGVTSTMVLRSEFKKMMRDTRAENSKVLRVSLYFRDCFGSETNFPNRQSRLNVGVLRMNSAY